MTWRVLLLAVGASALVACSALGAGAPPASQDTGGLDAILSGGLDERSQVPAFLRHTHWRLVTTDRGGESEDVEALNSSLTFEVDSVSGRTCNAFVAKVETATARRIQTGSFLSTRIGCGGPAGEVDHSVQQLLQGGAAWKRRDATLLLSREDLTLTFELQG